MNYMKYWVSRDKTKMGVVIVWKSAVRPKIDDAGFFREMSQTNRFLQKWGYKEFCYAYPTIKIDKGEVFYVKNFPSIRPRIKIKMVTVSPPINAKKLNSKWKMTP